MLRDLRLPLFCVGTENDHVAPWRSVFKLHGLTPAPLDFVLTSGGHNAGIVSEPGHPAPPLPQSGASRRRPHADAGRVAAGRARGSWWRLDELARRPFRQAPQAARPGRAAPRLSRAGGRARRLSWRKRMTPDLPARPASARVLRARRNAAAAAGGRCLSMAPDYQRPAAPVPTTYEQAPTADAERRRRPSTGATTTPPRSCRPDRQRAAQQPRPAHGAAARRGSARSRHPARATSSPIGVQADGSRARVPGDLNLTRQPQISSQYQ